MDQYLWNHWFWITFIVQIHVFDCLKEASLVPAKKTSWPSLKEEEASETFGLRKLKGRMLMSDSRSKSTESSKKFSSLEELPNVTNKSPGLSNRSSDFSRKSLVNTPRKSSQTSEFTRSSSQTKDLINKSSPALDLTNESSQTRDLIRMSSHTKDLTRLARQPVSTSQSVTVRRVSVRTSRGDQRRPKSIGRTNRTRLKTLQDDGGQTKTFLEKLFSRLKKFARVTLATKEKAGEVGSEPLPDQSPAPGQNKPPSLVQYWPVVTTRAPGHTDSTVRSSREKEGELSLGDGEDGDGERGEEEEVARGSINEGRLRSVQARGRSLPLEFFTGNSEDFVSQVDTVEQGDIISSDEKIELVKDRYLFNRKESIEEKQAEIIMERESKIDLLEFTNFLIIIVGVFVFISLSSVLVVMLVCHHRSRRGEGKECHSTHSDTSSCDSSHMSDTTSVSFNSAGMRSHKDSTFDDLYSLDNDYFLSSLEDISVQM